MTPALRCGGLVNRLQCIARWRYASGVGRVEFETAAKTASTTSFYVGIFFPGFLCAETVGSGCDLYHRVSKIPQSEGSPIDQGVNCMVFPIHQNTSTLKYVCITWPMARSVYYF